MGKALASIAKLFKNDIALGVSLFGVCAVLTFLLFVEAAGGVAVYQVIFGILAVSLDGTLAVLWIRGHREHRPGLIAVAACIVVFGLTSAAGSALKIVSFGDAREDSAKVATADLETDLELMNSKIRALTLRLASIPPDFTTQLKLVSKDLEFAEADRKAIRSRLDRARASQSASSSSSSTMFSMLSGLAGVSERKFKTVFLLGLLGTLYASALALTVPKKDKAAAPLLDIRLVQYGALAHLERSGRALCGRPQGTLVPNSNPLTPCCPTCVRQALRIKGVLR